MAKTKESKKKEKASAIDANRFPKKIKRRAQTPKGTHGGMRVLLTEDVRHVGKQGEVVEVKAGFGRNYLIPQGLATYVTPDALVRIEKHKAKVEAIRVARLQDLKLQAKELEKQSITIDANANEEGHLYGSVTGIDIARALEKANFKIAEEMVRLEGPLKELGLYHVKIHLAEEVEAEIKVWVVPTSEKDKAAE